MVVRIPISERARRYGYVIWPKSQDDEVKKLIPDQEIIVVSFDNRDLGKKRVDWKYRRISVGSSHTRTLGKEISDFELRSPTSGCLQISCC